MSAELRPQARAAMEAAWEVGTSKPTFKDEYEAGWKDASEFYVGRGYTPRSMLRAQAAQQGTCPICGKDTP